MSFVEFANKDDRPAAIFICTNGTGHPLMLDFKKIEYQSNGVWQSSTNLPKVNGIPTRGMGMPPQASALWFVPVHTTNIPWRLHILCVEPSTGVEGAVDKATDAVKSLV